MSCFFQLLVKIVSTRNDLGKLLVVYYFLTTIFLQDKLLDLQKKKSEPVKTEEALKVAKLIGAYKYIECSAKTKEGIETVINEAIKAALANQSKK